MVLLTQIFFDRRACKVDFAVMKESPPGNKNTHFIAPF